MASFSILEDNRTTMETRWGTVWSGSMLLAVTPTQYHTVKSIKVSTLSVTNGSVLTYENLVSATTDQPFEIEIFCAGFSDADSEWGIELIEEALSVTVLIRTRDNYIASPGDGLLVRPGASLRIEYMGAQFVLDKYGQWRREGIPLGSVITVTMMGDITPSNARFSGWRFSDNENNAVLISKDYAFEFGVSLPSPDLGVLLVEADYLRATGLILHGKRGTILHGKNGTILTDE